MGAPGEPVMAMHGFLSLYEGQESCLHSLWAPAGDLVWKQGPKEVSEQAQPWAEESLPIAKARQLACAPS